MEKHNVYDRRQVKLEQILKESTIPFMQGRPVREKVITEDDIYNLRIALNTESSIAELVLHI